MCMYLNLYRINNKAYNNERQYKSYKHHNMLNKVHYLAQNIPKSVPLSFHDGLISHKFSGILYHLYY